MDPRSTKHSALHAGVMPLLVASIFWALTLTVCPQLHEWLHPDADHEDHDCAVTLFASGGIHFVDIDLVDVRRHANWAFVDVHQLRPQVLVSAQTERLV
ncbi:MAG TPA: hypothetical protein VHS80_15180, partial [Chthoniobacterales bacterium]|nr:hypothetical protein [Chthoniobacterales bacterium]